MSTKLKGGRDENKKKKDVLPKEAEIRIGTTTTTRATSTNGDEVDGKSSNRYSKHLPSKSPSVSSSSSSSSLTRRSTARLSRMWSMCTKILHRSSSKDVLSRDGEISTKEDENVSVSMVLDKDILDAQNEKRHLSDIVRRVREDESVRKRFYREYVFGGSARISMLRDALQSGPKHVVLSNGNAKEICEAFDSVGILDRFYAVVDTAGNCGVSDTSALRKVVAKARILEEESKPPGVACDDGGANASRPYDVGRLKCLGSWTESFAKRGFSKDVFIVKAILSGDFLWKLAKTEPPKEFRVVYVDDKPELDTLPKDAVTVMGIPQESRGVLRKHVDTIASLKLTVDDIIIWDFDCTLAESHMYKTMNMRMSSLWREKWGPPLKKWWTALVAEKETGDP